jgi:proteic killer suppression protein
MDLRIVSGQVLNRYDVKTKKEPWRIILQPLDESMQPYNPCNIDEISGIVRIVEITEVSKHYE